MKTNRNPKMENDFLTNLPQEMMIDILLRLPILSIMSCKCVCKSWRYLIKTREFVDSHSSRSVPCLALFQSQIFSKTYKIIEFVDTQNSGENHCNMILNFSFPHQAIIHSSANGLLFLSNIDPRDLFICNPNTREYIKLPPPVWVSDTDYPNVYGFGVSKLAGEYKVVRLFYDCNRNHLTTPRKCEVYSLGRGFWRSIATAGNQLRYAEHMSFPISLNGSLYWLVDVSSHPRILCFDLETECFSSFYTPHIPHHHHHHHRSMCVLGNRLCLYDDSHGGFVIWVMNAKSWRKVTFIKIYNRDDPRVVVPIKVCEDGDILFVHQFITKLYCYSSKTRTIREIDAAQSFFKVGTIPSFYTPSFVPLKTFALENNVISF